MEARGGAWCRVLPLLQFVQAGAVIGVLVVFFLSWLGFKVEAASSWVGDCTASGSIRELLSGGLRRLAPLSRPDSKVVGQLLPCFSQAAPALSRRLAQSGFVPGGGTVARLAMASSKILEKYSEDLIVFCFRSRVSFALLQGLGCNF
jgi:hypothetical protein